MNRQLKEKSKTKLQERYFALMEEVGNTVRDSFKRHVFNAIFDAVNNHGVVADKAVVQSYTNRACDDFLEELLEGGNIDDVVDNSASRRPTPITVDKHHKLVASYAYNDWVQCLLEELSEIIDAILVEDAEEQIAEELQDLKHVCTSMQHWLGFDDKDIDKLCAETNEKNRKRGYLEKNCNGN